MEEASLKYLAGQVTSAMEKALPDDLGQHLVVEDKIVRVLIQGEGLQEPAGEGPVAGVILGQLGPQKDVLDQGQKRLATYFQMGMPPFKASPPRIREPRTQS